MRVLIFDIDVFPAYLTLGNCVRIRLERHSGQTERSEVRSGIREKGIISQISGFRLAARDTGLGRNDELQHSLSGPGMLESLKEIGVAWKHRD
jgi:hypothetical protein